MNYVAYSLFGDNPKYLVGALENAKRVPEVYPGFMAAFCVDAKTVPHVTVHQLKDLGAVVFAMQETLVQNKMLWRYLMIDSPSAEVVLCRDADSRITQREVAAVMEWLASPRGAHVMRDFPLHTSPIMGGTFGIKKASFPGLHIAGLWREYKRQHPDWTNPNDQIFLGRVLWPIIKRNVMEHDEFNKWPNTQRFPRAFDPAEGFVGEVFLENNQGIPEHKAFRGVAPFGPL